MKPSFTLPYAGLGIVAASILCSGCLMKRTVTRNGHTTQDQYVVKRPIKTLIKNTEFE